MRLLLVMILALAPGCYARHERVDRALCAPEGVHTIMVQATTTAECGLLGSGPTEVTIPPTPETIFGGRPVGEVVQVGPCRWEVSGSEAVPDVFFSIDGVIDTSDGTVRGTFDVEISGVVGRCMAELEWIETEEP